jgi:hypothetical protein
MGKRFFRIAIGTGLCIVLFACKGEQAVGPTAPSPPAQTLSIQSLRATPDGVGVLYNTVFQFEVIGTIPFGTQFFWQFGDGTSTTTNVPTASHAYTQTGSFGVTVEGRMGSSSSASTRQVSVRSLVGRWVGTMTGHTRFPPSRPVPITGFEITFHDSPAPNSSNFAPLRANWSDLAGCRESRPNLINQNFSPRATAEVDFGIESFFCNDGDFYLTGTADSRFDRVEGTCLTGGPNCRFQMTRQ